MVAAHFDYQPFGRQIEAHAAPERHVLLAGGWGGGKSKWLIGEALRNTGWMPGVPGIVVSPTFPIMRRTLYQTILNTLPRGNPDRPNRWPRGRDSARTCMGPAVKDWSALEHVLTLWNGTRWYLASAEDPGSMEGGEYGWGVMDEARLIRPEGWRIFNSRIRHPGSKLHRRSVASVPTMGWLYDEFGRGIAGRRVVRVSTEDNPYLPPGYTDTLNLSGRRALAFLHGHWVHLEGTVYETYQPAEDEAGGSVVPHTIDPSLASFGFLDFGRRRPYFGVIQSVPDLATDGTAGDIVCEELPGCDVLSEAHAVACSTLLKAHGLVLQDVYCDPAGNAPNAQTGIPDLRVYERVFRQDGVLAGQLLWTRTPTETYIPNGVEAVRSRFEDRFGIRRLFIAKHLTDPIRRVGYGEGVIGIHDALLGYRYPENKPGVDKPLKTGVEDHAMDALRYLIVGLYGVTEAPDIAAMNLDVPGRSVAGYDHGLDIGGDW